MLIIINLPLWGQRYIERWSNCAGRTLLAEGNLPSLAKSDDVELQIVTTLDDVNVLESLPIIEVMRQMCRVKVREMKKPKTVYEGMTVANVLTLRDAIEGKSKYLLTLGDQIWADGSLVNILKKLEQSHSVLSWSGILDRQSVIPQLVNFHRGLVIEIPPSRLAELAIRFPHPAQRNCMVEQGFVPRTPSSMIWVDPQASCTVIRSHILVMHGIDFAKIDKEKALRYVAKLSRGRVNDDVALYEYLFDDVGQITVVQNSEEVITVSLDDNRRSNVNTSRITVDQSKVKEATLNSLRKHQPWEPRLGRYFFSIPYVMSVRLDKEWARQTINETFDISVRASILHQKRFSLGSVWVRLSHRQKIRILWLFESLGLLRHISKKLIGYELRDKKRKPHEHSESVGTEES